LFDYAETTASILLCLYLIRGAGGRATKTVNGRHYTHIKDEGGGGEKSETQSEEELLE
jgi:hypothetical protein